MQIWKIHILPLLPNSLHNICQVSAESRQGKMPPSFRVTSRRQNVASLEVTSHGCASK